MNVQEFLRNLLSGPIAPQLRRFVLVGAVASGVQTVLLWMLVEYAGLEYLVGALLAIETTIIFQYVINNAWTFKASQNAGRIEYFVGLFKTNVVRGSAIPIQLSVLFALVTWYTIPYLIANLGAIGVSGIYRYVLDARWTWGD